MIGERSLIERLFGRPDAGVPGFLVARWIFLRALGLVFASAFLALLCQARGLVGTRGILPAAGYLGSVAAADIGLRRFWAVPTLFWIDAGDRALLAAAVAGLALSLLLVADVWPRLATALCTILFASFVAVLQDFSSYQSDGMLLEAGLLAVFLAPGHVLPRRVPDLHADEPPSRASVFLLQWEWFRIYFESGVVKLASGDPHWRNLTAMDDYYQNGPLPTWIAWHAAHLPHAFHAATALTTLVLELGVAWCLFLPRRFRALCFILVTPLQLGIILTANYAFLNYLVLSLGVFLLDDETMERLRLLAGRAPVARSGAHRGAAIVGDREPGTGNRVTAPPEAIPAHGRRLRVGLSAVVLTWVLYTSVANFLFPGAPLAAPARLLAPFRLGEAYGLFANMTEARYEIEFQGSRDGRWWIAYPFRFKPQDPFARPGFYAPYQPRFDWNLWFASLEPWQASPWVVAAQARLLENSPPVLALFRENPFRNAPPAYVRTVISQYWFTDQETKRVTGAWWRRRTLGPFSGTLTRRPDGRFELDQLPVSASPATGPQLLAPQTVTP